MGSPGYREVVVGLAQDKARPVLGGTQWIMSVGFIVAVDVTMS